MSVPFIVDDVSPTRIHGVSTNLKEATAVPDVGASTWTVTVEQNITGGIRYTVGAANRNEAIAALCINLAQ